MTFKIQYYVVLLIFTPLLLTSFVFLLLILVNGNIGDGFTLMFAGMIFLVSSFHVTRVLYLNRKFSSKTFDLYKARYPNAISGGRVKCFNCGSHRISVRGLLRQTYHREHVCSQCGTVLYYSPE